MRRGGGSDDEDLGGVSSPSQCSHASRGTHAPLVVARQSVVHSWYLGVWFESKSISSHACLV